MRLSNVVSILSTFAPKRQTIEEKIIRKAIVARDQAAGTAGMKLVERPEAKAAINDLGDIGALGALGAGAEMVGALIGSK